MFWLLSFSTSFFFCFSSLSFSLTLSFSTLSSRLLLMVSASGAPEECAMVAYIYTLSSSNYLYTKLSRALLIHSKNHASIVFKFIWNLCTTNNHFWTNFSGVTYVKSDIFSLGVPKDRILPLTMKFLLIYELFKIQGFLQSQGYLDNRYFITCEILE